MITKVTLTNNSKTLKTIGLYCLLVSLSLGGMEADRPSSSLPSKQASITSILENAKAKKAELDTQAEALKQALSHFYAELGSVQYTLTNDYLGNGSNRTSLFTPESVRHQMGPLETNALVIVAEVKALVNLKKSELKGRWAINRSLIERRINNTYRELLAVGFSFVPINLEYINLLIEAWRRICDRTAHLSSELISELRESIDESLQRRKSDLEHLVEFFRIQNITNASPFTDELGKFTWIIEMRGIHDARELGASIELFLTHVGEEPLSNQDQDAPHQSKEVEILAKKLEELSTHKDSLETVEYLTRSMPLIGEIAALYYISENQKTSELKHSLDLLLAQFVNSVFDTDVAERLNEEGLNPTNVIIALFLDGFGEVNSIITTLTNGKSLKQEKLQSTKALFLKLIGPARLIQNYEIVASLRLIIDFISHLESSGQELEEKTKQTIAPLLLRLMGMFELVQRSFNGAGCRVSSLAKEEREQQALKNFLMQLTPNALPEPAPRPHEPVTEERRAQLYAKYGKPGIDRSYSFDQ